MSKLQIEFIRPTLEFRSVVWDDYSVHNTDKVEKVQLYAASIVTGFLNLADKL